MLGWIVGLLAATAAGLSSYLWWAGASGVETVGCNAFAGLDCDAALASPWAKWLGAPVAAGGLGCYAVAFLGAVLAGLGGNAARVGWRLLEAIVPLASGAAVWFIAVQSFALESFCPYCVATHAVGLAMLGVLVVWRARSAATSPAILPLSPILLAEPAPRAVTRGAGPPALGLPTLAGVVGVVALVAGQTVFAPALVAEFEAQLPEGFEFSSVGVGSDAPPGDDDSVGETALPTRPKLAPARSPHGSREATFLRGQLRIDAYDHAVLGSPEAPHLVVELMDYACPHCRDFHGKLTEALERFEGKVAVVVMPVPGEISCNPHVRKARAKSVGACFAARLTLAVSRLAPEKFDEVHAWMLEDDKIPDRTKSLAEAWSHVDSDALSLALRDDEGDLAGRVKNYVDLAALIGRQGRFGLPAQIVGDSVIAGPVKTVDELCALWAKQFGIDEPKAEIPF